MKIHVALLCAALALAACQPAAGPEAQRAQQAAAREQAAAAMAAQFDEQFAAGNWRLAKAHGDVLLAEYPDSEAAARIEAQHAEASAKANEESEAARMEALWTYQSEPVGAEQQLSAAIYAKENVETDGATPRPVRLIFRDHPEWGDSAYLTLEAGDFDCYGGCKVTVTVDDTEPRKMDASRPDTDEAIAMFIEDEAALWKFAGEATVLSVEFPVKAGGTRTAVFETGGLQPSKLPDWN
ncbi:hypothetical protein N799_04795 [Lysobacter arseniciresistens ZS79]|uniref:Lipoprotein n=1 Tax=Lysobacter arseniciresistens ZS79 TaxID=913325 RepID=A0A0A0F4X7_9GAMM|nr:hypothetical protein [Lysobacter arseniciresistens]KGM56417.1 hypothetical protein N799_04795 [Lysobacter arseniciresistens ZS79]